MEGRVVFTRTLNPVTSAKEVAIATPEKETSTPRCPTIISDTTWRRYCETVTATIGAAMELILFSSWQNVLSNDDDATSCSPPFSSSGSAISLLVSLEFPMVWRMWNVHAKDVLQREIYIGAKVLLLSPSFFLPNQWFIYLWSNMLSHCRMRINNSCYMNQNNKTKTTLYVSNLSTRFCIRN